MTLIVTSQLFPMLFTPEAVQAFNWRTVFIPPNFLNPVEVHSLSEGMLVVLQYDGYCGSLATIIWTMYLRHEVKNGTLGVGLAFEQMRSVRNNREGRTPRKKARPLLETKIYSEILLRNS
jgi:hypothetical protein